MEVLSDIFEKRKNDSRWNTSYPLSPDDWKVYRVSGELSFSGEKKCLSIFTFLFVRAYVLFVNTQGCFVQVRSCRNSI